jgi:RNA polymerase-binding transcription factor DksA
MAVSKAKTKKKAVVLKKKKPAVKTAKPKKAVSKVKKTVKVKAVKKTEKEIFRKPVKTYLTDKELEYFKNLIMEEKNEILENARRLRDTLVDQNTGEYVGDNSTFSMHMAEQGSDEMEREKAFMFIQRDEKYLGYLHIKDYHIDQALESFQAGGWFGRGPGEGTVKRILPESHTDFVFAVAAEEFGIVLCLLLVALFAFIVLRGLRHSMTRGNDFCRLGAAGLAILLGLQSAINMAVNMHLIPAKGMTLPFISYGGSSMISVAYATGMLIALTRSGAPEK